jgi:hypothetical protein
MVKFTEVGMPLLPFFASFKWAVPFRRCCVLHLCFGSFSLAVRVGARTSGNSTRGDGLNQRV